MTGIGSRLRQAREARGLSLEQVQKATRIKLMFLEAIETDRFDDLPGPVQARGFIRSYASHVGLDADELLAQIDGSAGAPHPGTASAGTTQPEPIRLNTMATRPSTIGESKSGLPLPLPLLILVALLLFALGGFLIVRAFAGEAPPPSPTPLPNVVFSISRTPEPTPTVAVSTGVSLTLTAGEHVWVRVTHDGFTAYEGLFEPGESRAWQGDQQIIVETGNGAALSASVNGQPIGVLGPRNRVVVRAWGAEGEVTPAPTAAPVTPTPEATATPTA